MVWYHRVSRINLSEKIIVVCRPANRLRAPVVTIILDFARAGRWWASHKNSQRTIIEIGRNTPENG
jgi:hypothetical protein